MNSFKKSFRYKAVSKTSTQPWVMSIVNNLVVTPIEYRLLFTLMLFMAIRLLMIIVIVVKHFHVI